MMDLEQRADLPSLRPCDRAKLRAEVQKVDETAKSIYIHNFFELNYSLYVHVVAYVTTEKMGMLIERKGLRTEELEKKG